MSGAVYFFQVCPVCGRSLRIGVAYLGRTVACRHCRGEFTASLSDDRHEEALPSTGRTVAPSDELTTVDSSSPWSMS